MYKFIHKHTHRVFYIQLQVLKLRTLKVINFLLHVHEFIYFHCASHQTRITNRRMIMQIKNNPKKN